MSTTAHILLFCAFLCLSIQQGLAIKCYQCEGPDNLCTVGLLGEKMECPSSTKSCYKSWTVETSPLTKRKCADDREYEETCKDVLFGQNSMLACYCSDVDFCNSSITNCSNMWVMLTAAIFLLLQ